MTKAATTIQYAPDREHIFRFEQIKLTLFKTISLEKAIKPWNKLRTFPPTQSEGSTVVAASVAKRHKRKAPIFWWILSFCLGCSNYLSSRVVSNKVLSAQVSLTSVFGMRTGGTSPLSSPQWYIVKVALGNIGVFLNPQIHNCIVLTY